MLLGKSLCLIMYHTLIMRVAHDKFQLAAFYDVVMADERSVEDFAVQFDLFDVFVGGAVVLYQDFEYAAFHMNERFVDHPTA